MIGTFVIWVEDQHGFIAYSKTWRGLVSDGIAKVRQEMQMRGVRIADIWATPVANKC